jgi:hypothetical protein
MHGWSYSSPKKKKVKKQTKKKKEERNYVLGRSAFALEGFVQFCLDSGQVIDNLLRAFCGVGETHS